MSVSERGIEKMREREEKKNKERMKDGEIER